MPQNLGQLGCSGKTDVSGFLHSYSTTIGSQQVQTSTISPLTPAPTTQTGTRGILPAIEYIVVFSTAVAIISHCGMGVEEKIDAVDLVVL